MPIFSNRRTAGLDCSYPAAAVEHEGSDSSISPVSDILDRAVRELGALVDADLSKEGARLQALVIRQQLRAQRIPLGYPAPAALLSLSRHPNRCTGTAVQKPLST